MAKKQASHGESSAQAAEQVGFHKGALTTLAKERQEMARVLAIVEQLMQLHIEELKKLGVDIEKEAQKSAAQEKKPIE
ncbi:hypothetical protein HYU15_02870, partial [Candidatus Woesearchaeota archaeon]|nr:hypothetical protein [Candidatus Woesearchaeota archaeon]